MSMQLSKITRLLLWLLSKRDDIGAIRLHEADQEFIELPSEEYAELVSALSFEFSEDELPDDGETAAIGLAFDRSHLEDCFDAPSSDKSV